ncbi:hypothetical protein NXZ84_10175 [Mechercharimyces sp. CAU 1602]|nr:hypothetical protein [Mechercharimyces sp. CAU 1602]
MSIHWPGIIMSILLLVGIVVGVNLVVKSWIRYYIDYKLRKSKESQSRNR